MKKIAFLFLLILAFVSSQTSELEQKISAIAKGKYGIAVFVSNSKESETVNCGIISDISKAVGDNFNK
ncbi:hypothetical protein [Chryseobacterium joostei]|uniref:hypothetical protein n=1 Tax=Chryseobacterium joostei TaxID=112234 RepID=UPI003D09E0F3